MNVLFLIKSKNINYKKNYILSYFNGAIPPPIDNKRTYREQQGEPLGKYLFLEHLELLLTQLSISLFH